MRTPEPLQDTSVPESMRRAFDQLRRVVISAKPPERQFLEFGTNGAANPVVFSGPLAPLLIECVYSATGIYTLRFAPELNALRFVVSQAFGPVPFVALQSGPYNTQTRTLVVQTFVPGFATFTATAMATGASVVVEAV